MKKNRMKSKKSVYKRFKLTGSGKLKRSHSHTGHNAHNKTVKQRRQLRKPALVSNSDYQRIISLIKR